MYGSEGAGKKRSLPSSQLAQNSGGFTMYGNPKGLLRQGNLNIWNRPVVNNADGSYSTEYSTSFGDDKGREILVPTVVGGRFLTPSGAKPAEGSPEEKAMFRRAADHYYDTGENLGIFGNPKDADAYSEQLHNRGMMGKQIPSLDMRYWGK